MVFKDYKEFATPALALPFDGKVYTVPKPSLSTGLALTTAIEGGDTAAFEGGVDGQWKLVLGTAYDEMTADNVPIEFVSRAFLTAMADFQLGREAAEATWEVGSDPEALAAWFRSKYPEKQVADSTSTSTDTESATR